MQYLFNDLAAIETKQQRLPHIGQSFAFGKIFLGAAAVDFRKISAQPFFVNFNRRRLEAGAC